MVLIVIDVNGHILDSLDRCLNQRICFCNIYAGDIHGMAILASPTGSISVLPWLPPV